MLKIIDEASQCLVGWKQLPCSLEGEPLPWQSGSSLQQHKKDEQRKHRHAEKYGLDLVTQYCVGSTVQGQAVVFAPLHSGRCNKNLSRIKNRRQQVGLV